MTKKEIKEIFKMMNVQLGAGSIEVIEDELKRKVKLMASRCAYGNVKRLTPELIWIALGNTNNTVTIDELKMIDNGKSK